VNSDNPITLRGASAGSDLDAFVASIERLEPLDIGLYFLLD
jgi:hypothetical protein